MAIRVRDMMLAATLLLIISPVLLVLAACVAAETGWPVFFRQTRVGMGGTPFTLLKFRTMRTDPAAEAGFEAGSSRRVTRVGSVLRRLKLDELPQLVNVIRGDMGLVGPRPEVPSWVQRHRALFADTLRVRPGITDPASIVFRHEQELLAAADDPDETYARVILPAKLELSARYLHGRTGWRDLTVLWASLAAVLGLPHPWSKCDAGALLQARCNRLDAEGSG